MQPRTSAKPPSPKHGNPPTVFIVRHGETEFDVKGLMQGTLPGGLTPKGAREIAHDAVTLATAGVHYVYSSDLPRAAESAKIIAETCGCGPPMLSDELRPWDIGNLKGKPEKPSLAILDEYAEDHQDEPLPGGHESFNEWVARMLTEIDEILVDAVKDQSICAVVLHSLDVALLQASYAAPGGLNNHNIKGDGFLEADSLKNAGEMKLVFNGKEWKIVGNEPARVVSRGRSALEKTRV